MIWHTAHRRRKVVLGARATTGYSIMDKPLVAAVSASLTPSHSPAAHHTSSNTGSSLSPREFAALSLAAAVAAALLLCFCASLRCPRANGRRAMLAVPRSGTYEPANPRLAGSESPTEEPSMPQVTACSINDAASDIPPMQEG